MLINGGNLRSLYIGYSTAFQSGLGMVQPTWQNIAMEVPSTTRTQEYGWLGQMPRIREWIGERAVQNIGSYAYAIRNRPWELTIGVDREDIEDDNIGLYAPLFTEMGRTTASFPDELLWPLMNAGFSTPCYDGQYYFDTDHPVLDKNGTTYSVSNFTDGAGPAWFLIDDTRGYKPLIFQKRKSFEFVRMDAATDEVVFNRKEFRYGVDGRNNAGYGFWQVAYGSKAPLDQAGYQQARDAMQGQLGDYGRPLGLRPTLLVVPPSLEHAALQILNAELVAVPGVGGGTVAASNVYKGTARHIVSPWLAQ